MALGYGQFRLNKLSPAGAPEAAAAGGKGGSKKKEGLELVLGQPLLNKGACEHYKRSFRWLRFPGCGKAFPCDVCHELQCPDCEPGVWANRMICGFCSLEQGYSNKDCKCGGKIGGGASKTHWEGGAGCRNKVTMSNKDSKKFAGTCKTSSNKSERVGEKKP